VRYVRLLSLVVACAAAVAAAFACNSAPADVHDSDQAKNTPCVSCHGAAYTVASTPVHVGQMPQTCDTCHGTTAWVPSTATNHPWWPLQNKHVGVSCVACHDKGFEVGQTSKACVSCHQKDFDGVADPKHAGFFPLDCAYCHSDVGFKPSSFTHDWWPLEGRHSYRVTSCASCHPVGNPGPTWKATRNDCYGCHANDADNVAPAKNPNHGMFPHTCLDCHLMSGWTQGPPLSGLHPEASFPLKTGAHANPGIHCQDCHKLEKGLAAGGANTDCINCHVSTTTYPAGAHDVPAIDATHHMLADAGVGSAYDTAESTGTTNFCLQCHAKGQR
jgi:hypothetical protein